MDYSDTEAYEREKAAITSYEDGWDAWDGPVWPWRQTNISATQEEHFDGCCTENISGKASLHNMHWTILILT
jgi:hypothetical protein